MKPLTKQEIEKIRKNPNNQNWGYLSYHYKLTESFIKEFQDKIFWINISICQKLSEPFIFEFINKLDIDFILIYQKHLSKETKNKIELIYELKK